MKTPKFTIQTGEINPLDPFPPDTETDEFTQLYVIRDFKDIECVAEVRHCQPGCLMDDHEQCVEIGDCFDLRGNEITLTLEEQAESRQGWIKEQLRRAHDAILLTHEQRG